MRVQDVYSPYDKGTFISAASTLEQIKKPGLGSWLAVLFIGVFATAWVQNEQVVAWLLSQGIVGEGATRTLPGELRWASIGMALLSLLSAWRIGIWGVVGIYRWGPTQAFVNPIAAVLRTVFSGAWKPIARSVTAVGKSVEWLLSNIWSITSRVISTGASMLAYVRLTVLYGARAFAIVLEEVWFGITAVGRRVSLITERATLTIHHTLVPILRFGVYVGLRVLWLLWQVTAAFTAVVGLVFRLLDTAIKAVGQAIASLSTLVWSGITDAKLHTGIMLKRLGVSLIKMLAPILAYVTSKALTATQAAGYTAFILWRWEVGIALRVWLGVTKILAGFLSGLKFVLGYLTQGVTLITQGIALVLAGARTGAFSVARMVASILRLIGYGLIFGVVVVVLALRFIAVKTFAGLGFLVSSVAAIARIVWVTIRAAVMTYLVGVALVGLWSAVSFIAGRV
ncbi:MAG: hypothetical protein O7F09_03010, partial [Chloroflexi bacterium]|nr:hypothetical protein [Chloroflexota bacterium]